jgi:hypothetical protein
VGTQFDKLIMTGKIAPLSKRMGKPSVVSNGCQYQVHGKNSELVTGCVLRQMWYVQKEAEN